MFEYDDVNNDVRTEFTNMLWRIASQVNLHMLGLRHNHGSVLYISTGEIYKITVITVEPAVKHYFA